MKVICAELSPPQQRPDPDAGVSSARQPECGRGVSVYQCIMCDMPVFVCTLCCAATHVKWGNGVR